MDAERVCQEPRKSQTIPSPCSAKSILKVTCVALVEGPGICTLSSPFVETFKMNVRHASAASAWAQQWICGAFLAIETDPARSCAHSKIVCEALAKRAPTAEDATRSRWGAPPGAPNCSTPFTPVEVCRARAANRRFTSPGGRYR